MAKNNSDEHRKLEIRKCQNRRYYDRTRSRYLSLRQIHKLIIEGFHSRGSTGPICIVPGCPPERSGLIARAQPLKNYANAKQMLARFGNPCDIHSEAQESPGALTTKTKRRSKEKT